MALREQNPSAVAIPPSLARRGIASPADYDNSRRIMRGASRNYAYASAFLPADKRAYVEALYAFLRIGDDRVDVAYTGFASPEAALEDWERRYWQAFERGDSSHPVLRAYLDTAMACDISPDTMAPYFRAMREDLTITRFPTFAALKHYMEGSAVPVGRAMTAILGVRAPHTYIQAQNRADSLAIAMQLSNFWRDIGPDWDIGRIYIPLEDLDRFALQEADLVSGEVTPALVALLEFEIQRTERYYQHAREGVPMLASGRWGVMAGLEIYRAILTSIRRSGYDVFARRAGASRPVMLGLVLKARWLAGR